MFKSASQPPGLRCLHLVRGRRGQEPREHQPAVPPPHPRTALGLLPDQAPCLGWECPSPAQRPAGRKDTNAQMWEEGPEVGAAPWLASSCSPCPQMPSALSGQASPEPGGGRALELMEGQALWEGQLCPQGTSSRWAFRFTGEDAEKY